MKNILKNFLMILLCLPVVFACNDGLGNDNGKKFETKFVINDLPDVAEFEIGEVRTWTVTSENVETVDIAYPAGWFASCGEKELVVISPEENLQNAEPEGDVVILYSGTDGTAGQLVLHVVMNIETSNISFEIEYSDVTSASVKLKVVPSDKDAGYYYDVCTKAVYDKHEGNVAAIVEGVISDFANRQPGIDLSVILNVVLDHGDSEDVVEGLPSDTDMYFYAVGINEFGKACGTPAAKPFHTLAPGKPEDCTFNFEFVDLRASSVEVKVCPSDPSVRYWSSIEDAATWHGDAAVPVLVKETIDQYAAGNDLSVEEVVGYVTFRGTHTDTWGESDGILPNTSYYAYAFAMDEKGNAVGPLFKKKFTTKEYDVSDANIVLTYRYFNGDDLYDADSEKYPNAKGKVLVQVKASPNETADGWVVALSKGDLTDETTYPDEPTKNALIQNGQKNRNLQQYWVPEWTSCTLLAFAVDMYGIDGMLNRELIELKPEGASPISEVAPIESSQVMKPFSCAGKQLQNRPPFRRY